MYFENRNEYDYEDFRDRVEDNKFNPDDPEEMDYFERAMDWMEYIAYFR